MRVLLTLAALLLIAAQCLPWERAPVDRDPRADEWYAASSFSPITHVWTLESTESWPSHSGRFVIRCFAPGVVHTRLPSMDHIPSHLKVFLPLEIRECASSIFKGSLTAMATTPIAFVLGWFITLAAATALPFSAGLLSRARPILWLIRFFACCLLIGLVWNLISETSRNPDALLSNVGSGYWLTLAALALEITILFLIPNPRTEHLRQSS